MKDGIGKGRTCEDQPCWRAQLHAAYAHMQDVRSLPSGIGGQELGELDQKFLQFDRAFEREFINQG